MYDIVMKILSEPWLAILTGVGLCYVMGTMIHSVAGVFTRRAIEQSRREIAAYVAEGSIKPEHASLLMNMGEEQFDGNDPTQRLAKKVAEWQVDEDDAKRLGSFRQEVSEDIWRETVEMVIAGMPAEAAMEIGRGRKARNDGPWRESVGTVVAGVPVGAVIEVGRGRKGAGPSA